MANPLPTLRGTPQQLLYGFTRSVSCLTKVTIFNNGSEQRWVQRNPLYGFDLPMSDLSPTDRAAWDTFFNNAAVLGRYGTSLQITQGSTTYNNLGLTSDTQAQVATRALAYNMNAKLRQVVPVAGYTPPTVGSSFPLLAFGTGGGIAVAEFPMTSSAIFYNAVVDNPYGPRYVFPWYSGAVSGFPSGSLRAWHITYPLLTDADAATLENYFLGQQGRYGSFSFTDPISGTTYSHVRFGLDELQFKYLTVNNQSTEILLWQTNGS